MERLGITGQQGFIGTNLVNKLKNNFDIVPFKKEIFLYEKRLDEFVEQCDVIIHLAGMSKGNYIGLYNDSWDLAKKLLRSMAKMKSKAHLIFTSSVHEQEDSYYAQAKRQIREMMGGWAKTNESKFTGMILPNVFGGGARPKYSFIATFCNQLVEGKEPKIFKDLEIELIYIDELVKIFYDVIKNKKEGNPYIVKATSKNKISDILNILKCMNDNSKHFSNTFEMQLFKTLLYNEMVVKRHSCSCM